MNNNVIAEKTLRFAIRIVNLKKYLVAEKNKVALDMEFNMRDCDYHRGYAEGINQALAVIGFKHERMAELLELLD